MDQDADHLWVLSIFHYVVAGLAAFCSLFLVLYTVMGFVFVALAHHPPSNPTQQPPPAALGWAFAIVLAFAGQSLCRRRHYWFVFVVACIECIFVLFGTILGAFTIIVFSRESVKMLFSGMTQQTSG